MTSPLPDVGEHLFGPSWRSRHLLGAALDVNPRRVRAWAAGEEPVPDGVWRDLYEMLRQQAVENARLSAAVMAEIYPREEGR